VVDFGRTDSREEGERRVTSRSSQGETDYMSDLLGSAALLGKSLGLKRRSCVEGKHGYP